MKVRHTLLGSAVAACLGLCTATAHAEGSLSIYHWFEYIPQELLDKFACLLYTSPSPRDGLLSRMPSSA